MKVALSFLGCHRRGGVERIMVECSNYLQRNGHEIHVFASDWDADVLNDGIVRHNVQCSTWSPVWHIIEYSRLSREALNRLCPPADVHCGFGVPSMPGAVVWVQSVHRAWLETSRKQRSFIGRLKQKGNLAHPLLLSMEQEYYGKRRYGKLIALSDRVRDDLQLHYGVPSDDIVNLPNGYSPEEFNSQRCRDMRDAMRESLGYSASDRVVIFVANELERKGFWPLAQAIHRLGNPEVKLLVVGRVNANAYRNALKHLNLSSRVRYVGSTCNVASYYAAADVFALPTQYEAWGLVIVEAMACGLPVLTSRLAGAAVAVREGETGELLDDPSDVDEIYRKLNSLLSSSSTSAQDIESSVSAYAWSRVLKQYERILTENMTERSQAREAAMC